MVKGSMEFTKLEILQKQRLEEVGKYLYTVRQEQEITLEEIERRTKIQKHQLVAIEQGELNRLLPAIYTRGFIRIYADFLNCNGRQLAATFPTEVNL